MPTDNEAVTFYSSIKFINSYRSRLVVRKDAGPSTSTVMLHVEIIY